MLKFNENMRIGGFHEPGSAFRPGQPLPPCLGQLARCADCRPLACDSMQTRASGRRQSLTLRLVPAIRSATAGCRPGNPPGPALPAPAGERRRYRSRCSTRPRGVSYSDDQSIGRAAHGPCFAQRPQQAAGQRGLAGPQVALQMQHQGRPVCRQAVRHAAQPAARWRFIRQENRPADTAHALTAVAPARRATAAPHPGPACRECRAARSDRRPAHAHTRAAAAQSNGSPPCASRPAIAPGQHIAHAGHGHAGIAPVAQPRDLALAPDQRACALEHRRCRRAARTSACQRGETIALHLPVR